MMKTLSIFTLVIFCMVVIGGCDKPETTEPISTEKTPSPVNILVMDPLSAELACACVAGFAQRDYHALAEHLEKELGREVNVVFSESLGSIPGGIEVDIVIGKQSVIAYDAVKTGMTLAPVASLTGLDGSVNLRGLFIVRGDDQAETLADVKKGKYRLQLGPVEATEKHQAGKDALKLAGLADLVTIDPASSCNEAAMSVIEKKADLAVVSDYALPLLDGCGTINAGELKVIGQTAPVGFIALYVNSKAGSIDAATLRKALEAANTNPELLKTLESKKGFVFSDQLSWMQWRGPKRTGSCAFLPKVLAQNPKRLWSTGLTGSGMSGLAATPQVLIVADKSPDESADVWRCLDADSGKEIWSLAYKAPEEMDYTNSPRANPLIHNNRVY
ncbi:MAG TPA: hypothetical protein ENL03_04460, partial [Phycisphaerae bacterium]|nr:hypothetical protein [Phycisphaerae bacterium]